MGAARMSSSLKANEASASTPLPVTSERGGRGFVRRRAGLRHLHMSHSHAMRYGMATSLVALAFTATYLLQAGTGKFFNFPFYAVVVAGAWLGIGPGLLSLALSSLVVADFATPPLFSLAISRVDLPSFLAFVIFALMTLAWSIQRRRAEHALEATVRERTAELVQANAALKAEMTERETAQQALRDAEAELARTLRLATMAELAAAIAHEINQPLAAITANGSACLRSLQRDPPLLDNARDAAGCIVADGHRAGDVIARIRALFSKGPQQRQLVNLNETVNTVLALARGAIERQRVAVRSEPAPPPPLVAADPVQLQQVLVNLVTNALEAMQATPEGERLMTIRTQVRGDTAAVSVEDSGVGIDPERVGHIFDSFYTTKPGGIGVGLAISRSIIDAHGGSMWAAPATPAGAVVGFELPLAQPEDRAAGGKAG
jgi:C4-dicarboxylate-specific signal transduction histidine kinase